MAISYPLSLPTVTGIAQIELRATNAVAYSRSPFTFAGQAHAYAGQMWQADVTLPAMNRASAEEWVSFLISLRGQFGTFLLGDPAGATPRGIAATLAGSPTVDGADQTGGTLDITGASRNKTNWLRAGDYIQIGTGSNSKLYKVLTNTNTNNSGECTVDIWPHIRTAHANGASITTSNAKGLFRLAANETSWSVNEASIYGITFGAMEAL
mgnify:FL=1